MMSDKVINAVITHRFITYHFFFVCLTNGNRFSAQ